MYSILMCILLIVLISSQSTITELEFHVWSELSIHQCPLILFRFRNNCVQLSLCIVTEQLYEISYNNLEEMPHLTQMFE